MQRTHRNEKQKSEAMSTLVVRYHHKANQLQPMHRFEIQRNHKKIFKPKKHKQAISAREQALCQLTVCYKLHGTSGSRNGHKSCALIMVFRSTKLTTLM